MAAYDPARFNLFWFVWLIAPAAIMLTAAYLKKRYVTVVAIALSLSFTYAFSNLAVVEKWKIRAQTAITERQQEAATADGANKVFTRLIFAPLEAVFLTGFWFWVGRKVWKPRNRAGEGGDT